MTPQPFAQPIQHNTHIVFKKASSEQYINVNTRVCMLKNIKYVIGMSEKSSRQCRRRSLVNDVTKSLAGLTARLNYKILRKMDCNLVS